MGLGGLTPEALLEELGRTLPDCPPPPDPRWSLEGRAESAVAVPLQPAGDDLLIWLTKRPAGMRHHAREIAFPGGKRDPEDRTLVETALRELEEEVGVPARAVRVLGALAPVPTKTSLFVLSPFVVALRPDQGAHPSPDEVAMLVRLSLDAVLEARVPFRAIEIGDRRSPIFDLGGRAGSVYGATAHVLEDILRRCAGLTHRTLPEPSLTKEIPWN